MNLFEKSVFVNFSLNKESSWPLRVKYSTRHFSLAVSTVCIETTDSKQIGDYAEKVDLSKYY